MKVSIICLTAFLSFVCEEKQPEPGSLHHFPHGMYSGKYFYTANGTTDSGTVEIVFRDTSFQCIPINTGHLLPGNGVYDFIDDTLEVMDQSTRKESYNALSVMEGKFSYLTQGNNLVLIQQSGSHSVTKKFELIRTN